MKTTRNITREGDVVEVELYGGKIKVEYNDYKHTYKVNGKRAKYSVTSVLDVNFDGIISWGVGITIDNLKRRYKDGEVIDDIVIESERGAWKTHRKELANVGSSIHRWIEGHIKGKNPKLPEDELVLNGVLSFLKMVEAHGIRFVESEKIVYSITHEYIGIMDCTFTMADEDHKIFHAGDFKTVKEIPKKEFPKDRYQLSAYQSADTEESGRKYGNGWIFYIDRNKGDFSAKEIKNVDKDFLVFKTKLFVKNYEATL